VLGASVEFDGTRAINRVKVNIVGEFPNITSQEIWY